MCFLAFVFEFPACFETYFDRLNLILKSEKKNQNWTRIDQDGSAQLQKDPEMVPRELLIYPTMGDLDTIQPGSHSPLDYGVWGNFEARACSTSHANVAALKSTVEKEWTEMSDEYEEGVQGLLALFGGHIGDQWWPF